MLWRDVKCRSLLGALGIFSLVIGSYGSASAQLYHWKVFAAADSGLPDDRVTALATRADGALWVGTERGLALLHYGAWEIFTAADSDLPDNSVQTLIVGPDGALWIGTKRGLARLHEGVWEVFTTASSDLPHDSVTALAVEVDGALWVGTAGGLARLHDGTWEVLTEVNSNLPSDNVKAMALDRDGALWVGCAEVATNTNSPRSNGGGLARLHEGVWEVFTAADSGLPSDNVSALAVGPDGALWVGSKLSFESDSAEDRPETVAGGLARLHEGAWEVFTKADSGLPSDHVSALAVGPDGALWVGSTLSLEWDSADDRVGIGAGSLARLHEGAWEVLTEASSDLPSNSVEALAVGPDGALWIGTFRGLARLQDAVWEVFTAASSDLPNDSVWALAVGPDRALWVGTSGGLARLHERAWEVFTQDNSDLPNDYVRALAWVLTARSGSGPLEAWRGCTRGRGRSSLRTTAIFLATT